MAVVMSQLLSSVATGVFIIFQVGISDAYGGLHAPTFAYYPLITIRDTRSVYIPVVTVVPHSEDIQVADIHFSVMSVQTEETSVETFAKPPTDLRHHHEMPMFNLVVISEFPRVVITRYVEGEFLCQSHFEAEVGRGGCPIEGIGLDSEFR